MIPIVGAILFGIVVGVNVFARRMRADRVAVEHIAGRKGAYRRCR